MFEQDALPATAATNNHNCFTVVNFEINAAQHLHAIEGFAEILDLNHTGRILLKITAMKKLAMSTVNEDTTTASVVARPTPSAPSSALNPL